MEKFIQHKEVQRELVIVSTRLYTLKCDQGYFDCGHALGRQVLLSYSVHHIIIHWFEMTGELVKVERIRMAVNPPTFPGSTIYQTGTAYQAEVGDELHAVRAQIEFAPADIHIQKFESDEASIEDLPGELEEYRRSPSSFSVDVRRHFEAWIKEWNEEQRFVLAWDEEFWVSAEGEVLSH